MRVVQVVAPARYGGAESVTLHLAAALRDAGVESAVAAILPEASDHPFEQSVRRLGLECLPIVTPHRRYDRQVRALADHARVLGADVLHAHNPHANLIARWAARRTGRTCVATFHGHLGRTPRERAYEWLDLVALCTMSAVLTVSHAAARELAARAPCVARRLHTVPSALQGGQSLPRADARAALGVGPDVTLIGWVGRFSSEKDPLLFLQSLARVPDGSWAAVMLGDGPLLGPAARLAGELGLTHRIKFAGWRPDAPTLTGAFDVLAITSQREQLPTVMLEALSAAVPVVSVPVGDVPLYAARGAGVELAEHETGALAAALASLLVDSDRRAALAAAGAAHVRAHHDPARWAARHVVLYAERAAAEAPPHE